MSDGTDRSGVPEDRNHTEGAGAFSHLRATPRIATPPVGFTGRQVEIVELIAAGHSAVEIGSRLGISARTVRMHCEVLRAKLRVPRSRQIPVAFLLRTGIDPLASGVFQADG